MLDLFSLLAVGLGYLLYRTVNAPPVVDEIAAVEAKPRVGYQPLSKIILRDTLDVVPLGAGKNLGHTGSPRVEVKDPVNGIRYHVYTHDYQRTKANLDS